ncbi:hypothetical protein [Spirochaeta cellobiosiphila]|uniref:hypothetical protein n=1 Tax=Spirochaeta cellobiosiphila TaxID=504483 RepID=UPI0003FC6441|nr:hypothetical protein [Spirochaeta cellobiosiphila]
MNEILRNKIESFNFLSWEHRKENPPQNISYTKQLTNNEIDLRLVITQLNLSTGKQKKLNDEWAEILPYLNNVKQLFLYSSVPQKIFDAITRMTNLEGLFVKWSGNRIRNFENISKLKSLKRLYLGSSTQTSDLKFIRNLSNLEWLEIHEQKNLHSIEGIESILNLKGFILSGGINGKQKINDIEPIKYLHELEYLGLPSTYIESEKLNPICNLKKLKYLNLPIYYPMKQYARIAAYIPNCDHGINAYRETGYKCTKCKTGVRVKPMRKNSKELCLNCDNIKIGVIIKEFNDLRERYVDEM